MFVEYIKRLIRGTYLYILSKNWQGGLQGDLIFDGADEKTGDW